MKWAAAIAVVMMGLSRSAVAGTITGIVTTEFDGKPVAGVSMEATDYDTGEYCAAATTNSVGLYILPNLATGVYRIKALTWNTDLVEEYYDNTLDSDHATPVVVSSLGVVQNINLQLALGGTITGVVTNSSGAPVSSLWVTASDYDTGRYRGGASTDSLGFYAISRLAAGVYRVSPSTQDTDFLREFYDDVADSDRAAPVVVEAGGVVQNIDFSLQAGGLTASGKVIDKATGVALANVRVTYWHNDFKVWIYDDTGADGTYRLRGLLPGDVTIRAEPGLYYACMGRELELTTSVEDLDFMLPEGATLSGRVIDAETGQSLAGIEVVCSNDTYSGWRTDVTKSNGTFTMTNLPPGTAEIRAMPDVDSGYAWNLPGPACRTYLHEGEVKPGQLIPLRKGTLVTGYIKDPGGKPLGSFECDYSGRLCGGWSQTNLKGQYRIRLSVGAYVIAVDDDEFMALPEEVTIIDIDQPVTVPDMIVYSQRSGGRISGTVRLTDGSPKAGSLILVVLQTGAIADPNAWHTTRAVSQMDLQGAGPFTVTGLPPDVNYDVLLLVENDTPDSTQSCTVRDSASNVPVGTAGLDLHYDPQGSTVAGKVLDASGQPAFGAVVFLGRSTVGDFAGFAEVDPNGNYVFYDVPGGTYVATAIHSTHRNASKTVHVVDGVTANVETIIMPFAEGETSLNRLTGTWSVHGLNSGDAPAWLGWSRLELSVDDWGYFSIVPGTYLNSSGETDAGGSGRLTAAGDGVLSIRFDADEDNRNAHGGVTDDRDFAVITTDDEGGYGLSILQKHSGTVFSTRDLAGQWSIYGAVSGDAPARTKWYHFDETVGNDGAFVSTADSYIDSDGETDFATSDVAVTAIDGTISVAGIPSFHGTLSGSKDLVVGTMSTHQGEYDLHIALKRTDTPFLPSDMTGMWRVHALAVGDAPQWTGWAYATLQIDANGLSKGTMSFSDGDSKTVEGTADLARNGDFEMGLGTLAHVHGTMNAGKDLIACVMTDESGSNYLVIMTRATERTSFVTPVYRFWSPIYSRHFYTISESEKQNLIDHYSYIWTCEGAAYYALADGNEPGTLPVYRFWSPSQSAHFYTIGESEKDMLVRDFSSVWTLEGIAFYAYPEGSQPPGAAAVYRFWSSTLSCHFYTISEAEKDELVRNWPHVWAYEGIAWYAYLP